MPHAMKSGSFLPRTCVAEQVRCLPVATSLRMNWSLRRTALVQDPRRRSARDPAGPGRRRSEVCRVSDRPGAVAHGGDAA